MREALPYPNASFDVVLSSFGVMFHAPAPARAADENAARALVPAGRIAMANWTPTSFIGRLFKVIGAHIAPPVCEVAVLCGAASRTSRSCLARARRRFTRAAALQVPLPLGGALARGVPHAVRARARPSAHSMRQRGVARRRHHGAAGRIPTRLRPARWWYRAKVPRSDHHQSLRKQWTPIMKLSILSRLRGHRDAGGGVARDVGNNVGPCRRHHRLEPALGAPHRRGASAHRRRCAMALLTAAYQAAQDVSRGAPTSPQAVDAAIAAAHRTETTSRCQRRRRRSRPPSRPRLPRCRRRGAGAATRRRRGACGSAGPGRARCRDAPCTADTYRPHYDPWHPVPTAMPAVTLCKAQALVAEQRRPVPPGRAACVGSERWARDFQRGQGSRARQQAAQRRAKPRSGASGLPCCRPSNTASCARWPHSRDATRWPTAFVRHRRVQVAMDDALIAVMDAKYAYCLWRPVTAIRNGDIRWVMTTPNATPHGPR